jgi:hypothetical protein
MRLPDGVSQLGGPTRNFIWRSLMKRFAILPLTLLALAISTGAQGTSGDQPAASAEAQTNANASASASTSASHAKQGTSPKQGSAHSSTSGSASASNSAGASAKAGDSSLNLSSDSAIQATLLTSVDARHSKPGDQVLARTTQDVKQDGHVVLRKGTKLIGHVSEAQARSKSHAESSVGVVFDNAVMKGGQQAPIHLGIQALAAAANQTSASMGNDTQMLASSGSTAGSGRVAGGGLLGGTGGAVSGASSGAGTVAGNVGQTANGAAGATARTATSVAGGAAGSAGGLNAVGQLTSDSRGVFGLEGLNLNAAASNATQGSVVSSTSRDVHLDSGTQMVLQVVKQ